MKRAAFFALALLAELLSWPFIIIGFIAGVCVLAFATYYERGRWGYPAVDRVEEDEDE